jgi:hypothetical protein
MILLDIKLVDEANPDLLPSACMLHEEVEDADINAMVASIGGVKAYLWVAQTTAAVPNGWHKLTPHLLQRLQMDKLPDGAKLQVVKPSGYHWATRCTPDVTVPLHWPPFHYGYALMQHDFDYISQPQLRVHCTATLAWPACSQWYTVVATRVLLHAQLHQCCCLLKVEAWQ